jgi:hypothetical protein
MPLISLCNTCQSIHIGSKVQQAARGHSLTAVGAADALIDVQI